MLKCKTSASRFAPLLAILGVASLFVLVSQLNTLRLGWKRQSLEFRQTISCPKALATGRDAAKDLTSVKATMERNTANCSTTKTPSWAARDTPYNTTNISIALTNSPKLAFAVVLHSNPGILEELLDMIFDPAKNHSYCFHIDPKAGNATRQALEAVIECRRSKHPEARIHLVEDPVSVYWGHISLLEADLKCLRILYDRESDWDYALTLAGSELPRFGLDTLEEILGLVLAGRSSVASATMQEKYKGRYLFKHKLKTSKDSSWDQYKLVPRSTGRKKSPPPRGLRIFKGMKSVVLNRTFTEFILESDVSRDFRIWARDMLIPDESFYATMVRVKGMDPSGNVIQDLRSPPLVFSPICVRYAIWDTGDPFPSCHGSVRRDVCNLSLWDLPTIERNAGSCLFVNKFDLAVDPLASRCWVEHVKSMEKTRRFHQVV